MLRALLPRLREVPQWTNVRFYDEEATFGAFMTEVLDDRDGDPKPKLRRLRACLQEIERESIRPDFRFVAERAHPSYYALLPRWELYEETDRRFAVCGALIVLLEIPEADLVHRSLHRKEHEGRAGGFVAIYGSEANALEAIEQSVRLRREAVCRSASPHVTIETKEKRWNDYADLILGALRT